MPEEAGVSESLENLNLEGTVTVAATPQVHSTALLGQKLERAREARFDSVAAAGRAAGGDLAAQVATQATNIHHLHDSASGNPFLEGMSGLVPVNAHVSDEAPRRVGKQLHPKWVSQRDAKPSMGALWKDWERQPQVCSISGVETPSLLLVDSIRDPNY
eukprot:CAMPEP_0196588808 /NCGR_PEP_ID=MMETSP1081-20130531/61781_1 /TAXON_ID=36882 /ORGANISM="Pyramimonas amylifera, Strain CCMP720" /LENGTH=158 /DNA_ID=CAMNT_0041911429 /DNA_START=33 /DNA_END=509 /DNA_ORIENTATION=-